MFRRIFSGSNKNKDGSADTPTAAVLDLQQKYEILQRRLQYLEQQLEAEISKLGEGDVSHMASFSRRQQALMREVDATHAYMMQLFQLQKLLQGQTPGPSDADNGSLPAGQSDPRSAKQVGLVRAQLGSDACGNANRHAGMSSNCYHIRFCLALSPF